MSTRQPKVKLAAVRKSNDKPLGGMGASTGLNVFDAALDRIRWLFEEFDGDVAVSNSGGKDSTVVLELAAMVAKERGELPLRVTFLDQECELQGTVDYQRYLMYERDDIDFRWYQIPFRLENVTNLQNPWLDVWDERLTPDQWVRPKEPGSIHVSPFPGFKHFYKLLSSINGSTARAVLSGMRAEESPNRRMTLTAAPVYKWVTWGSLAPNKKRDEGPFRFHPIYDWSYRDVWKAIHDNGWRYNVIYDHQFRYGVQVRNMRVSNYHHETALSTLTWLQEVEPETWEAATRRLEGITTYGQLRRDQYPDQLPYMFASWDEYACYLIENLIPDAEGRRIFYKFRARLYQYCGHLPDAAWAAALARCVITNDRWGTTADNYAKLHMDPDPEARRARKAITVATTDTTDTTEGSDDGEE